MRLLPLPCLRHAKSQGDWLRLRERGSQNQRSTDFASFKYDPLKATLKEGQEIKKIFPDTNILTGEKATEAAIKQL